MLLEENYLLVCWSAWARLGLLVCLGLSGLERCGRYIYLQESQVDPGKSDARQPDGK